jgi:hypothetical protein
MMPRRVAGIDDFVALVPLIKPDACFEHRAFRLTSPHADGGNAQAWTLL